MGGNGGNCQLFDRNGRGKAAAQASRVREDGNI